MLTIVGSQIEAAGAEELAKALNIKELNLSHCSISCAAMSALAGGLQGSQKLTHLVCTSCALRSEHIEALPRALTSQSQIKILDLSENQIDCDGATTLARALLEDSKLRKLSLRRNEIADRGARAFADALRRRAAMESQPLRLLDLDDNEIDAPGWKLLDQALEEVESLAEAWFDKFQLGTHKKPEMLQTRLDCQRANSILHLNCLSLHFGVGVCGFLGSLNEGKYKYWDNRNHNDVALFSMFLALALAVWCLVGLAKRAGCQGIGSRKFKLSVWRTYNLVISLFGVVSGRLNMMSWRAVGLTWLNQDIWIGALVLLEMLLFGWVQEPTAQTQPSRLNLEVLSAFYLASMRFFLS